MLNILIAGLLATMPIAAFASTTNMAPIVSYLLSDSASSTNQAPIVDAGEDKSIFENGSTQLSATASDTDGHIVSYSWKDGNTLLSDKITFTFTPNSIATYTLTFTATDNMGKSSSDTLDVIVAPVSQVSEVPIVDAGVDRVKYINTHVTITPTATDNDGTIVSYEWKKGNSVIGTSQTLTNYKLEAVGDEILVFSATDNDGNIGSDTMILRCLPEKNTILVNSSIINLPINLVLTKNSINIISPTTFNERGGVTNYTWIKRGENSIIISQERDLAFNPTQTGRASFELIVLYNDGKLYRDEMTVDIVEPTAFAEAGDDIFVQLNQSVHIQGVGSNGDQTPVTFKWHEGDTLLSTSQTFDYTPTTAGVHTLKFTVTNEDAQSASDTMRILPFVSETGSSTIVIDSKNFQVKRTTLIQGRDDGKGLDYVMISDGFINSELDRFRVTSYDFANYMLNYDPKISKQKAAWNIYIVEVVSNESGTDSTYGIDTVDTPFDSGYNCNNIQRLFCSDTGKLISALNQVVPFAEQAVIIANSYVLGGGGGQFATVPSSGHSKDTIVHELGHTLAGLGDEYSYGSTTAINYEPRPLNVTAITDLDKVGWKHWIGEEAGFNNGEQQFVGLYEGAYYHPLDVYRPTYTSFMRSKGKPMYPVNAEAWALAVYRIASTHYSQTPQNSSVSQTQGSNTHFSIEPSMGSDAQKITWFVDGTIQNISDEEFSFDFGASKTQAYQVKAIIEDKTGVIRKDDNNASTSTIVWNILPQKNQTTLSKPLL